MTANDDDWDWKLTDRAEQDYEQLHPHEQERLVSKLDDIVADQWRVPGDYPEPLTGAPHSTLRSVAFRVGCEAVGATNRETLSKQLVREITEHLFQASDCVRCVSLGCHRFDNTGGEHGGGEFFVASVPIIDEGSVRLDHRTVESFGKRLCLFLLVRRAEESRLLFDAAVRCPCVVERVTDFVGEYDACLEPGEVIRLTPDLDQSDSAPIFPANSLVTKCDIVVDSIDEIFPGRKVGDSIRAAILFVERYRIDEWEIEASHVRPPFRDGSRDWFVRFLVAFTFRFLALAVELSGFLQGLTALSKREWGVLVTETNEPIR